MEEKIKAKYDCISLDGNDPLVVWYNQVIEKTMDELTVADVARCIRQNLFSDMACEMLVVYLLHNPYEGDVYKGEFMDKAGEMDEEFYLKYRSSLLEIIQNARHFIEMYEWECDEDQTEYEEAVNKVSDMIH